MSSPNDWLQPIVASLPLLADISRADILLYYRQGKDKAKVIAQARPHSVPPVHEETLIGQTISLQADSDVWRAIQRGREIQSVHDVSAHRTHVSREIFPLRDREGKVVGALSLEKSLIEHERHRRRVPIFRQTLRALILMVLNQGLPGVENLSPFGEQDGLIVADKKGRILYMSGLATKLYRKLGYTDNLEGKYLADLDTGDAHLMLRALNAGTCLEEEAEEGEFYWTRKVIPLTGTSPRLPAFARRRWFGGRGSPQPIGVLITLHDSTRARRKARERAVRAAMIQEIHHRVKNNLQTIASLLRIQARRIDDPRARVMLEESVNRLHSVAVVHEFLSQHEGQIINIKDVATHVVAQFQNSSFYPGERVRLKVEGTSVFLSAKQATSCALVINELVQNALEHAYGEGRAGTVVVSLQDEGDNLTIAVQDDGRGLPPNFSLEDNSHLGLRIVRTLIEQDLQGKFEVYSEKGAHAVAHIPKTIPEGEV